MAVLAHQDFVPSRRYRHSHYSTCAPSLFGRVPEVGYDRKRVTTPDGDFLDLDYVKNGNKRVAIICHGLEGSSSSIYVLLQAEYLIKKGWDILSLNYRGCSGEMNHQLQMYNSGETRDLYFVADHHVADYDEIVFIGYSLGGNLVLKYAGEYPDRVHPKVSSVVAISTPLDLHDSSEHLLKWDNYLYQLLFLKSLKAKIRAKSKQFPDQVSLKHLRKCYNLYRFDEYYTAPIWGYRDAKDYYDSCASIQWIDQINVPTLIINAMNDPFLGPRCYPTDLISRLPHINMLTPAYGGHVGFAYSRDDRSWLLDQVDHFLNDKTEYLS